MVTKNKQNFNKLKLEFKKRWKVLRKLYFKVWKTIKRI